MATRKTAQDYFAQLASIVIARTVLTDLAPGSVLAHLLSSIALSMAQYEIRLERFRDSFFLDNLRGAELDERARELPPGGVERLSAVAASGQVLTVTRSPFVGALTIPVGALLVENAEQPGVLYRNTGEVVFADGEATLTGVSITATSRGSRSNASTGAIRVVAKADINASITISVSNTGPLSNGFDQESDDEFRARVRSYFGSLSRCLPSSLLFLARSHISDSGERAKFVSVYEDPLRRGTCDLVVDDGTGGAGGRRVGQPVSNTVSSGGVKILYHEFPSVRPIDRITVVRGGNTISLRAADGDFISHHERGIVYVEDGRLLEGDTWEISTHTDGSPYEVYTGLVASLQRVIEPNLSNPSLNPGWRGAGIRVAVRPATRKDVRFDVHILPRSGVTLESVSEPVKELCTQFMQSLPPGATLYEAQLIAQVMGLSDILSVKLYKPNTSSALGDVSPDQHLQALRTATNLIRVIPRPETD